MNTDKRTKRRTRLLIGIPAGIILLGVIVLALIPPLVMNNIVNRHVTFAETWTGAEQGLDPKGSS